MKYVVKLVNIVIHGMINIVSKMGANLMENAVFIASGVSPSQEEIFKSIIKKQHREEIKKWLIYIDMMNIVFLMVRERQ